MDLAFTEEQEAIRSLARDIFAGHATAARLREVEASPERFDPALWAELARAGLLGVAVPEAAGGIGGGILEACLLLEEAASAVAPVPLWPSIVLGALPVAHFGTDEQARAHLGALAAGEAVLSAALTEPAADPLAPAATAAWEGDAWRLDGEKTAVPAAHLATRVLVAARAEAGTGLFLVDPRAGGVVLERQAATGGEIAHLMRLRGAPVPEADVLVEPGADPDALAWVVDHALAGLCAMQVGLAERALRLTAEYLCGREQFGKPLGAFAAVQQRAADCYIDVEAMRWTTWQAAWRLSEGLPATAEVAIAKFWAAEGGQRVLAAAQHLHGGIGVDVDYPLHRYTLAAKRIELTLGGAHAQLARLGASMAEAGR